MKDLHRGDKEDVYVVQEDVGPLVKEHSVSILMCELSVSVDRTDIVSPSWLTMSCLFQLKENTQTPHSNSFSLMMSEKNEKSFMSPGALDSRRVKFRVNSMSLAPAIST